MIQAIFNDKKSYEDLGIAIEKISIQAPSKRKIKESVPFMNSSYDFSTVGSDGEIVYTQRKIDVRFGLNVKNRSLLYIKYSKVMDWLLGVGQEQLIFTDMSDYYYLAEVESAPDFDEVIKRHGKFDVEFIAEPFKYGVNLVGDEEWDTFNFEEDIMQETEFDVSGSSTVNIYNPGRIVTPTINCDSSMTCLLNGYTANFSTGDNTDYDFKLQPGYNSITITGSGHINFKFRKEMI